MSTALDALPCGVATFLPDGALLVTNAALRAMVGLTAEEVPESVSGLLTLPCRIFCQTHVFPLIRAQGTVEEIYLDLRHQDGAKIPILMNAWQRERDGQTVVEAVFLAMRRRSLYEDEILRARREAQAAQERLEVRTTELEELKRELEGRVALRTEELSRANEELRGFVYSLVHDVGAPLRAIDSTSAILLTEDAEGLSEEQRSLLGRQSVNVRKLHALIEGLLNYARLGQNEIEKRPLGFSSLANDIVRALQHGDRYSHVDFEVQPGMEAIADARAMSVVLTSLLENAIKYSPDGGRIVVARQDEAFCVRDEGIGFEMVYAERIFRPFERLHRDAEFEGTGIGLANVKRIVERHGGRVWAESEPGKGSTFFFTLS